MKLGPFVRLGIWTLLLLSGAAPAQTPGAQEQQYLFSVLPLIEKGQFNEAEQKLQKGLELYPRSAILSNALGTVYRKQNKTGPAIAAFQRALDLLPSFTAAQLHLAILLQQQHRKPEAIKLFAAVGHSTSNFEAVSAAGLGLAECEDYSGAVQVLEKAQSLQPDSVPVVYNLSLARYKTGQFRTALETLRSLRFPEEGSYDLFFLRGQIRQALNEKGAGDDLAQACRQQPSESYCVEASLALLREERMMEAVACLQSGLSAASSSTTLHSVLGLAQFRLGKYPEAMESYKRALEQDPASDGSREGLAFLLYMTGDLQAARAATEAGLKNPHADFYLDQLRAMILYRLSSEHWKEALHSIDQAITKNPRFAPSYFLRGKIEVERQEWEAAIRDFQTAAQLDDRYPLPHYRLAQIYLRLGRLNEAEAARKKFFELGQQREEELLVKQTQDLLIKRGGR